MVEQIFHFYRRHDRAFYWLGGFLALIAACGSYLLLFCALNHECKSIVLRWLGWLQ